MPEQVTLEFPDGAFSAIQLSPTEFAEALKRAAVCKWYELGMVSQAKAAELLGVSRVQLMHVLAAHRSSWVQDTAAELEAELHRIAAPPDLVHRGKVLLALGSALAVALLVVGIVAVVRVTASLVEREPVQITGHRGSSLHTPENSLAAIRQAIADSADFAEIDVQETSDGQVVVVHDADLARLAGVARKVREMTFDEVRAVDIGTPVGPQFAGEKVPTLDEVLEAAKGKIGVNIERGRIPIGIARDDMAKVAGADSESRRIRSPHRFARGPGAWYPDAA